MAKYQYRITGKTQWSSTPGTALFAITNKVGSGKKITVQSIEISNATRLGYMNAIDTQSAVPTRYILMKTDYASGGELLNSKAAKFDTNFPDVSAVGNAPVEIRTGAAWNATLLQWGNTTYTDATVAVGDVTFTPGSAPSPAWIANEHRDAGRYFIGTSGNVGTYLITANTTTALTLDPPLQNAVSTSGYIAEFKGRSNSVVKSFNTSSSTPQVINRVLGQLDNAGRGFGTIYGDVKGVSGGITPFIVNAGETYSLVTPFANSSNPGYISCIFSVINGANRYNYSVDFHTALVGDRESIISFYNPVDSNNVLKIIQIEYTETGGHDTPYFQVVPISGVEATSYSDQTKKVEVIKYDTSYPDISSSVSEIFTNVPLYPYGVPFVYIAESSTGSPKGLNYLATKDFIGPVYATLFPEAAAYKTAGSSTALSPGSLHVGIDTSVVRGRTPLTFREGEGIAIVSGAETAAGTINVGVAHSSWGTYDFGITFSIENATTPYLVLTGLPDNTEVRVLEAGTQNEYAGSENITGGTFIWAYDYNPGMAVDIAIINLAYQFQRLNNVSLTQNGISIPIQLISDRNYINP